MSVKVILLVLISLAIGVLGAVKFVQWSKGMSNEYSQNLRITAAGLDQFGITLQIPYDGRSPNHVLLLNNSQHHIIACQLTFEFVTSEGELRPAHKIVAYSDLLQEEDLVKRRILLKRQPAIAPNTEWLIGMGVDPDLVLIKDRIPPLPAAGQVTEYSKQQFKQLTIKLTAVVFENGEAVGPSSAEFLEHLRTEVLEEEK
jgi:hypothetical protein